MYLRIFILLYADDSVIFGVYATDFQKNLDVFYEYARMWQLDINFDKTKILIFSTRNDDHFHFNMDENEIQLGKEFKYFGAVFAKSRSFCKAKKHNYDQANKVIHLLYKRIRNLIPLSTYNYSFLSTQFCQLRFMDVRFGLLKILKSFKNYKINFLGIYMLHADYAASP